jgi:hypothetical protein
MMGRGSGDQASLFYEFRLDDRVPKNHLLRRINVFVTAILADVHEQLAAYYSEIGRPSVDPELMIRMLIVGYCYGVRSERRLTREVELHLAYRWFCRLDLDDKVPHQRGGHHQRPKLNSTDDASRGTTIEVGPFSTASVKGGSWPNVRARSAHPLKAENADSGAGRSTFPVLKISFPVIGSEVACSGTQGIGSEMPIVSALFEASGAASG